MKNEIIHFTKEEKDYILTFCGLILFMNAVDRLGTK